MEKEKPATKLCKYCKTEISYDAKVCPQCRKKQSNSGCLIAFGILVVAISLFVSCSVGRVADEVYSDAKSEKVTEAATVETTAAPIDYAAYNVDDMMNDLNTNALKASEKYKSQYVEITGKLSVIDSSGKYISLTPVNEDFAIIGVTCYIKNDDQKAQVMEMSQGDIVILRGKITQVGEVLGYYLDITEIN